MLQELGKRTDGILLPTKYPLQRHESAGEINRDHLELLMAHLSATGVSPEQYSCIPSSEFSLHTSK
jgi:hypothetical protein